MKVFELAKELGVESKELLSKLESEGITLTSHLAALTDEQESVARSLFVTAKTAEPVKTSKTKAPYKFNGNHNFPVRSNVYGVLVYVNHKTGDKTVWSGYGDVQLMYGQDLQDMRGGQVSFFEGNWITILGDDDDDEAAPEDIYKALRVDKYYTQFADSTDFSTVLTWSEAEIGKNIEFMSTSRKRALVVTLNELIKCGSLDSLRKIHAFEEALNCELLDIS